MDIQCIVKDVFSEYNVGPNTEEAIQEEIVAEMKKEMSNYLDSLMGEFDGLDAYGIIQSIKDEIC